MVRGGSEYTVMNEQHFYILNRLSIRDFVSGSELAKELSVSRTTVNNYIKYLQELGVNIFCISGRGYKLNKPVELLKKDKLLTALLETNYPFSENNVHFQHVIDSTNLFLQNYREKTQEKVCLAIADYQTLGRGRQGRKWVSPIGQNLTFSLGYRFELPLHSLSTLSLRAGLAIRDALLTKPFDIKLKWPNDLFLYEKKLGGILIQLFSEAHGITTAIIGIGLNVNYSCKTVNKYYDATSLNEYYGCKIDRYKLLGLIVKYLLSEFNSLDEGDNDDIKERWRESDIGFGKMVNIIKPSGDLLGTGRGIDDSGAYIVELNNGNKELVHSGDLTIRVAG